MTVSIRRLTAVLGLFLAGAVAERLGSRTILIAGSLLQVATTVELQTKVREDFTITGKAPTRVFSLFLLVLSN